MSGGRILWDLPTRIFHWGLVCCLPLAWLTAEIGNYEAHSWIGYTVIVLVVTRVMWGLVGSRHSRFTDFLVGPGGLQAYLRGQGYRSAGHNPLGGWSIVVMLLLLLLQAGSGLFNSDESTKWPSTRYWHWWRCMSVPCSTTSSGSKRGCCRPCGGAGRRVAKGANHQCRRGSR
jgi:cytochrome b